MLPIHRANIIMHNVQKILHIILDKLHIQYYDIDVLRNEYKEYLKRRPTMTLGEKLKELRRDKGLSQEAVAREAGISRRSYIMYEQDDSMPKKRETYEELAKALGCDEEDLLIYKDATTASSLVGAAAALTVLGSVLGTAAIPMAAVVPGASIAALTIGNVSRNMSKKLKSTTQDKAEDDALHYHNEMLLQYENRQRKFQATATGIIYSKLAAEGITFSPGNKANLDTLGGSPDEYILVQEPKKYEWWFSFWAIDNELDRNVIMTAKDRAAFMISRYTTASFDENRKVTIVVDDDSLFDAVINYKDHNSYHGNMSVMLVDVEKVSVVKEELIASL